MSENSNVINEIINKNKYKKYLEIGTQHGATFKSIKCNNKICVDPDKLYKDLTFNETSDEFFNHNKETFDIIFIDGLHLYEQVLKDIDNALEVLNEGGTIVVHDILPTDEKMQKREPTGGSWTGDVWKAWIILRQTRDNLSMYAINKFPGFGIITRGSQELISDKTPVEKLDWNWYINNKKLMNIKWNI